MRLPMKPSQTPDTTAVFLIVLPSFIAVASTSLRRLCATHDLEQLHDVRGAEEMRADHVRGRRRERPRCDRRRASRCWSRGSRRGFIDLVELAEHLLLDAHVFEHGLDHDVRLRDVRVGERRLEQRHARVELVRGQLALLDLTLRRRRGFARCPRRARVARPRAAWTGIPAFRKLIEMPPPIVPAPITRGGLDLAHRCRFGNVVDARRGALGKEKVRKARDTVPCSSSANSRAPRRRPARTAAPTRPPRRCTRAAPGNSRNAVLTPCCAQTR